MFEGCLPAQSCILAIGAHPDDVVLSVGGLLAQLIGRGHRVVVLTLTSGEMAGIADRREDEEVEAMDRLGAEVMFARLADGRFSKREAIDAIDRAVRGCDPAVALVHAPQDTHQDHVTAFEAATVSCRRVPTLLSYESPSSLGFEPTITVDIGSTWDCKAYALEAYASQMAGGRLETWVECVARFRAWPRHAGSVCEALRVCHAGSLPGLDAPVNLTVGEGLSARRRPAAARAG